MHIFKSFLHLPVNMYLREGTFPRKLIHPKKIIIISVKAILIQFLHTWVMQYSFSGEIWRKSILKRVSRENGVYSVLTLLFYQVRLATAGIRLHDHVIADLCHLSGDCLIVVLIFLSQIPTRWMYVWNILVTPEAPTFR